MRNNLPATADGKAEMESSASLSKSLLLRVQTNDPDGWARLVSLFGPVVYSWCRRAGLSEEDAADVGQEVFLAVARKVADFHRDQPGDSFRGWLWGITRHKIRDCWRRHAAEPPGPGGSAALDRLAQIAIEESGVRSSAGDSRPPGAFHRALEGIQAEFEERTWQAFWRVTVEGQTPAEVAAALRMSPGAVYVAKSRVLRRLRDEFGDGLV